MEKSDVVYRLGLTKDQFRERMIEIVDACSDVLGKGRRPIRPHGVAHVVLPSSKGPTDARVILNDLGGRMEPAELISGMDYMGHCARKSGGVLQSAFFVHQCDVVLADVASKEDLAIEKLVKHPSRRKCLFITGVLTIYSEGDPIDTSNLPQEIVAKLKMLSTTPLTPLSVTAAFAVDELAGVPMINRKPLFASFQDGMPQGVGLPKACVFAFAGVPTDSIIESEGGESMFPRGHSDEGDRQAFPFSIGEEDVE